MTFSITILRIKYLILTLSITHTLPYAKCYFAECHILFIFMLNDVLSSAIMFDVTVLNAVMLSLVADLFMANESAIAK